VTVADAYQATGAGRPCSWVRWRHGPEDNGIEVFRNYVLDGNTQMLEVFDHLGAERQLETDGLWRVDLRSRRGSDNSPTPPPDGRSSRSLVASGDWRACSHRSGAASSGLAATPHRTHPPTRPTPIRCDTASEAEFDTLARSWMTGSATATTAEGFEPPVGRASLERPAPAARYLLPMSPNHTPRQLRRRSPGCCSGWSCVAGASPRWSPADLGLGPWDVLHQGICRSCSASRSARGHPGRDPRPRRCGSRCASARGSARS
jgi:hypothetical protein